MTVGATPELSVSETADATVETLAAFLADAIRDAVAGRGECRLAFAGGRTPRLLYERLAEPDLAAAIPWDRVVVFWSDERHVAPEDPDRNERMTRETLLDRLPVTPRVIHGIDAALPPAAAAADYARRLGETPLDVVLLGMGDDGHTASIFPGGPDGSDGPERVVATRSPQAPHDRVTLSLATLNKARVVVFLVTGAGKASRFAQVFAQRAEPVTRATLPAARVRPARGVVHFFTDAAAARELDPSATRDQRKDGNAMTTPATAQFGMIGLAVMGRNLALNIADHGFRVAGWNRSQDLVEQAVAESGGRLLGVDSLDALLATLERPRKIMLLIKAGAPVDSVLGQLRPRLDPGDVVIDGGNSWFEDTRRRSAEMADAGIRFFGVGVSGGEDGARHGPSLMAGGDPTGYELIRPILEAIAARTDSGPCVTHVGPDGAGHFVKMVHNGIEYADMQFIAEAYHLMQTRLGLDPPALAEVFGAWNRGPLESFLIEITAQIFTVPDPRGPGWLIDAVLDKAGQKGTGRWTAQVALELGVPIPSIAAAIDGRVLSSLKEQRVVMAPQLGGPGPGGDAARITTDDVRDALYAAKIGAYAQGMELIEAASRKYEWNVNPREIARIWKGGCIIRARFLDVMMRAWERDPALVNLLVDEEIRGTLATLQTPWRRVVTAAIDAGVPVPGMSASLSYYDSLRHERMPQNLVQAQRDAFGAHTYRRLDDPDGAAVHTDWLD
ncbi:MAG: NADP-dependent phosphogluconate dehydrogenase [Phycisphaerales bacterium]|nr:NADP-dependent phosphogluconate dehydrogenase [Phycisphaerae bacterium]NNF41466.1 NADP-dependent phosphogluconate dehydrogenase [Phycisphaerales bacterium]NNM25014.1 NADP-dependent phosphogluconate dehydrogenase [Phycisphaerales bacterium]